MIVIRIVGEALEKARKSPRLVPVTRMVTRDGTTFPQTVWVLPEYAKHGKVSGGQGSLFNFDGPAPAMQGDLFDENENTSSVAARSDEKKPSGDSPLYIENLSEKAIIVKGDTKTHKDAIKAAGGKWMGKYGGWMFPKSKETAVREKLGALLGGGKNPEDQKSKGHIAFFDAGGKKKEAYQTENGDIYTAQMDDVIDAQTGNRIGRWEGPAHSRDAILSKLGIKSNKKVVPVVPVKPEAKPVTAEEEPTEPDAPKPDEFTFEANGDTKTARITLEDRPTISGKTKQVKVISVYGSKDKETPEWTKQAEKDELVARSWVEHLHKKYGKNESGGAAKESAESESKNPDEALPVGSTKTENGVTYRLNENHRWERVDEEEKKPEEPKQEESTEGPASVRSRMELKNHTQEVRYGTSTFEAVFLDGEPVARVAEVWISGRGQGFSVVPMKENKKRSFFDKSNHIVEWGKTKEEVLEKYSVILYAQEQEKKAREAESKERAKKIRDAKRAALIANATPATRNEVERGLEDEPEEPVKPKAAEPYNFVPKLINFTAGGFQDRPVKDFTDAIPARVVLVNKKKILETPRPSYIPEIDEKTIEKAQGRIEGVKLGPDKYLIVTKNQSANNPSYISKYHHEYNDYAVVNLAVLTATQDYYTKRRNARYEETKKKAIELANDVVSIMKKLNQAIGDREATVDDAMPIVSAMERYSGLSEGFRKEFAEMAIRPYSAFIRMKARGGYASVDDYAKSYLTRAERDAKGSKPKSIGTNRATYSHLGLISFVKPESKGETSKWREVNEYIADMKQMSIDLNLQMDENENTYAKGRETSYGRKGAVKDMYDSHGVVVKRQNGDEITSVEVDEIRKALSEVYSVFGDRSGLAKKSNLLISHSGEKLMHARKASGIYSPGMNAIGVTWNNGQSGAGFTLAHEFAHFMDNKLGEKGGRYSYASDDRNGLEYDIAETFRRNMAEEQESDYQNRTCECFARALEQFFAVETGNHEEYQSAWNGGGNHPSHDEYMKKVYPKVKRFFEERNELLKSFRVVFQ